jgi:hypothetical protein
VPDSTDTITILTCATGHRCAKRYTAIDAPPEDYDAGLRFEAESVPVASLAELAELLEALRHAPEAMVIRGRLKADAGEGPYLRRCLDRQGEPAPFERTPHRWVMLDADNTAVPFDAADRRACVEAWRATLPEGLRDAAMVFQFSASAHRSETLRGHAFVWLSEPASDRQLRAWAAANGFDPAIYNPVQPHYTADPVFEGCEDPLAPRSLVYLEGGDAELELPEESDLDANAQRSRELEALGDVDASPEAEAARERLVKTLAPYFRERGIRWSLCGPIGGACAKAGLPAAECAEIVAGLLECAEDECDVDAGVMRALGAYELADPSTATGYGELSRLTARPDGKPSLAAFTFQRELERFAARFQNKTHGAVAINTDQRELARFAARFATPTQETPSAGTELEPAPADDLGPFASPVDLTTEPEPIAYLIPELALGPGKISLVSGYPGTAKGLFLSLLSLAVAGGVRCLDFEVQRARVLYTDFETGRVAETRLKRLALGLGLDLGALTREGWFEFHHMPQTIDVGWIKFCERICRAREIGLLAVDSYSSANESADANEAAFATLAKNLGQLSMATGVTVAVTAHNKKAGKRQEGADLEQVSGHNAFVGAAQTVIMLKRPDDTKKTRIEVSCARAPDEGFPTFGIEWRDDVPAEVKPSELVKNKHRWPLTCVVTDAAAPDAQAERQTQAEQIIGWLREHRPDGLPASLSTIATGVGKGGKIGPISETVRAMILDGRLAANFQAHLIDEPSGRGKARTVWLPGLARSGVGETQLGAQPVQPVAKPAGTKREGFGARFARRK